MSSEIKTTAIINIGRLFHQYLHWKQTIESRDDGSGGVGGWSDTEHLVFRLTGQEVDELVEQIADFVERTHEKD